MNAFVGVFMTVEYGLKAVIAAPVRWAIGGDEPKDVLCLIMDPDNEMAEISPDSQIVRQLPNEEIVLMRVPRYAKLKDMFLKMKDTKVVIESIAGNEQISLTIAGKPATVSEALSLPYVKSLYDWRFPTKENPYYTILVDINQLGSISQMIVI